ncbi:MAG: hypothetical protein ACYDAC_08660 [Candidatus Dormibacteria bacterium]
MSDAQPGVDLSGLHREIDRLKTQLCRCQHQGTCLACRGFEVLREQSQMVVAAASQPVLMQVAQEAAVNDLVGQLGGLQERLAGDPQLQEMMMRMMDRVSEDLGGPEEMAKLFARLGLPVDGPPGETPSGNAASDSWDDRPRPPAAGPSETPPGAPEPPPPAS